MNWAFHKKNWINSPKWAKPFQILSLLLLFSTSAYSGEIGFFGGYFNMNVNTSTQSSSLGNLGSYQVMYHQQLNANLEFGLGYTLIMSNIVGGDLAYGLDFATSYYPFTKSSAFFSEDDSYSLAIIDKIRPYGSFSFHQRTFQSIRSNYAGFSLSLGTEYGLDEIMSLKSEMRYAYLFGPIGAYLLEFCFFMGISLYI